MSWESWPKPPDDTGLGIHGGANGAYPLGRPEHWAEWVGRVKAMGFTWYKVVSMGDSGLEAAKYLLANGIMPIIRLYRGAPNPGSMVDDDPKGVQAVPLFVAAGCRYIEVNNEPNLFLEWAGDKNAEGVPFSWQNINPRQPDAVADSWAKDARYVLSQGGLPGIPAMAPGGNYNDIDFLRGFFARIKSTNNASLLTDGVWLSVHPAGFNHPIGYPFDAVNQEGRPLQPCEFGAHKWRLGSEAEVNAERIKGMNKDQVLLAVNAEGKDKGASNSWQKWRAVAELFKQTFGFYVPVLGTEGGFWIGQGQDPRYHILDEWDQSDRTRTVCEQMMAGEYPDWYFCTGFWRIAGQGMEDTFGEEEPWYTLRAGETGHWPVVDNLMEMPKHPRFPYNGSTPEPEEPPTEEEIRNEAWNHPRAVSGIPYNPDHAFPAYARDLGLGAPLNDTWDWRGLRMQGYVLGVVYAKVGDWDNINFLEW